MLSCVFSTMNFLKKNNKIVPHFFYLKVVEKKLKKSKKKFDLRFFRTQINSFFDEENVNDEVQNATQRN